MWGTPDILPTGVPNEPDEALAFPSKKLREERIRTGHAGREGAPVATYFVGHRVSFRWKSGLAGGWSAVQGPIWLERFSYARTREGLRPHTGGEFAFEPLHSPLFEVAGVLFGRHTL